MSKMQAADRIKRRMGRRIFGRAKGQGLECPRRPETPRPADEIDSRGEEAGWCFVGGEKPHRL